MKPRPFTLLVLMLCAPREASAHLVSTRFGELYNGILHPVTALQHVVPWFALGLLGGLQLPTTARWALLALPLSAGLGSWLGSSLPACALVEYMNLASFVVLGCLVALGRELRLAPFVGVTALFGLSHGYANAAAELRGSALLAYLCGVGLAAYLLVALITGFAQLLARQPRWGQIALRAAGSWILAIGVIVGGSSLLALR